MKRKEFIRQLIRDGCVLLRSGSRHDIYLNLRTGQKQTVPRHTEIEHRLARHIRTYLGLARAEQGERADG
jgi:predicted RNA binding protein YcfA (HicA-like mRNA interferase family)